jgi:hypothetical protein
LNQLLEDELLQIGGTFRQIKEKFGPNGSGKHLFGNYSELKGTAFTFAKPAAKRTIWFATVSI